MAEALSHITTLPLFNCGTKKFSKKYKNRSPLSVPS
jgi:hypothetical protein